MFFKSNFTPISTGHDAAVELYKRKSAAELCSSAFISVDRKWRVTYWNQGAERIFKVQPDAIMGKNVWDFFYTIIPVEFYGFYDRIFLVGATFQFSYFWAEINDWIEVCTFSEPDGFSLSIKTHASPEGEYKYNQSHFLYPIYRFITETKQESLWNWKIDSGERFWIDGGLRKLFGYNIENTFLPHAFWENRIHPDDLDRVRTSIEQFVQSNEHDWLLHYRFRKADGDYIAIYETGLKFYNQDYKVEEVIGAMYEEGKNQRTEDRGARHRTQRQKEIAGAILSAQEAERHEIGYKLNEDLSQILAIAKVYIQLSVTSPLSREIYLEKANLLIDEVIAGIRSITDDIMLPNINLIGLIQNLEHLCMNSPALHSFTMDFTYDGFNQEELGEAFQAAIFRIIQVQIRVIAAGSGAAHVHIDLRRKGERIVLLVSDDRQLTDMEVEKEANGFINIQSRAGMFNGNASLHEGKENHCILKVVFPLDKIKREEPVSLRNHS